MSPLRVDIQILSKLDEELRNIATGLEDTKPLHDRIAGDAEAWLKEDVGPRIAAGQHRTANTLGATPTGHLEDAYQGIEGTGTTDGAELLVPGATRLRAAFGKYVLTPQNGSKYLTIPAHRDAYGKRAGEFDDLFFMRVGPKRTPVLARRVEGTKDDSLRTRPGQRREARRFTQAEVMYVLAASATIPEDKTLIPFDKLEVKALLSAGNYLDDILEERSQP